MKITILFILALIISAEAISIKQKKQELTNLCTKISHSQVVPDNKKKEFNSYIEQIKQQRENTAALAGIGLIAGLFLAPFIAPAFAAAGLFGAAATSSGLAAMGGGSLAAGGFGMLGGTIVSGLGGAAIGSVISYSNYQNEFHNFITKYNSNYDDTITIGEYKIYGQFEYKNGQNYFNGPATIYKNNAKIFDGKILCINDCSLLGTFY